MGPKVRARPGCQQTFRAVIQTDQKTIQKTVLPLGKVFLGVTPLTLFARHAPDPS